MANINSPAVTAIAANNPPIVDKTAYLGTPKLIPFWIDNGVSLINNADTITFTKALPPDCYALGVYLKSAGVGSGSTLTFKIGTTSVTAALAVGSAIEGFYYFTTAGATTINAGGSVITGLVGTADWDDGANDLWGHILLITNQ